MAFDASGATVPRPADARLYLEGYASLFGVEDLSGDVVHQGAFRQCLMERGGLSLPMLLDHVAEPIGQWFCVKEDARGLFVRGWLDEDSTRSRRAADHVRARLMDGLSIGFLARRSRPRPGRGRDLLELDLWEVSIVQFPMATQARIRLLRDS